MIKILREVLSLNARGGNAMSARLGMRLAGARRRRACRSGEDHLESNARFFLRAVGVKRISARCSKNQPRCQNNLRKAIITRRLRRMSRLEALISKCKCASISAININHAHRFEHGHCRRIK